MLHPLTNRGRGHLEWPRGESNSHAHEGHRGLSSACLPFHHQAVCRRQDSNLHATRAPDSHSGGSTKFPPLRRSRASGSRTRTTLVPQTSGLPSSPPPDQCPPRESNPHASRHQGLGPACLPFHQRDVVAAPGLEPVFRGYGPREATTASLLRSASDWSRTSTPEGTRA